MRPPRPACRSAFAAIPASALALILLAGDIAEARGGQSIFDPFGLFARQRRAAARHRRPVQRARPAVPAPPAQTPPAPPSEAAPKAEPPPAKAEPATPPATADAKAAPPEPPARPAEFSPPKPVPLPPHRPGDFAVSDEPAPTTVVAPAPPARPSELSGSIASVQPAVDDSDCLARLDKLGVTYRKLPPITNGQCSVPSPIVVSALDGTPVKPEPTLTCGVTEALAKWTPAVKAAAEAELKDTVKSFAVGGGYECRAMNHGDVDVKLSEHAFANALDVMGFTFGKHQPLPVHAAQDGTAEAKFLASIRAKACPLFATVLGPGTNAAHANHFHLDDRKRSGSYRICE